MDSNQTPFALVVDDDAIVRMDACAMMRDAGFRPVEAETGDEAKRILEARNGDVILVFSDIEMPGDTNGLALAAYIVERWPDVEVVLASGRLRPREDELPGRTTFVPKPFDETVVYEHLARTLPDGKKPEPLKARTEA